MADSRPLRVLTFNTGSAGQDNSCIAVAEQIKDMRPGVELISVALPPIENASALSALGERRKIVSEKLGSDLPDIVIAAGYNTLDAVAIKKIGAEQGHNIYIASINQPPGYTDQFNLIARSQDLISRPLKRNEMPMIGVPSHVTPMSLYQGANTWGNAFAREVRSPYIAAFVGGNAGNYQFSMQQGIALAEKLKRVAMNSNASIIISNSPRTPPEIWAEMQNRLKGSRLYSHDVHDGDPNPMMGMLALSEAVIVTGDTRSMASDAKCARDHRNMEQGKPVLIEMPTGLNAFEYRKFSESVIKDGHALRFHGNEDIRNLKDSWTAKPLDTAHQVADRIVRDLAL